MRNGFEKRARIIAGGRGQNLLGLPLLNDFSGAHAKLDCHAVLVRRVSWGDGAETIAICTHPRDHRPRPTDATGDDALVTDRSRNGNRADDGPAKRKGRVARTAHLAEAFGRSRGGPAKADLTVLALRALIHDAGQEPLKYAATVLGIDDTDQLRDVLRTLADQIAADLVRVAAAVACGIAEGHIYWSPTSPPCAEYLALLCQTGWTPDDWTAQHLTGASA